MKLYIHILTFAVLPLIVHLQNVQYVTLTQEDKEYLLKQLPTNHKLSIPMQQFFNQSYFRLPAERSKRQFMLYQPESYDPAPPAYQMNLPLPALPMINTQANQPSYVLISPPIGTHPDFAFVPQSQVRGATYPQWPKDVWTGLHMYATTSTTHKVNWEEFVNNAVVEAGNLKKGIQIPNHIPVDPKTLSSYSAYRDALTTIIPPENLDIYKVVQEKMAGTTETPLKSSPIILRQVEVVIATSPPVTSQAPQSLITPSSSLTSMSSQAIAYSSLETSSVESDVQMLGPKTSINSPLQTSLNKSPLMFKAQDESRLLTTRNSHEVPASSTKFNALLNPDIMALLAPSRPVNLPSYNKSECDGMKADMGLGIGASNGTTLDSSPLTTTGTSQMDTQNDSQIKEKLMNILKSVESIKPQVVAPLEGLPCSILGKWISTLAGSGFSIEQTSGFNFNVPLLPAKTDGFLKGEGWKVTASTPIKDGNLFVLTAARSTDYNMATFTGECRTCNAEEVITGHWLIVKPALTCEEMNRGQDFFGDTWKRDLTPDSSANANSANCNVVTGTNQTNAT